MDKLLVAVVLVLAILMMGCTDTPKSTKLLKSQGYTKIYITGYPAVGCGEYDFWKTGFTAISPSGKRVTGIVCEGVTKGQTIRFR